MTNFEYNQRVYYVMEQEIALLKTQLAEANVEIARLKAEPGFLTASMNDAEFRRVYAEECAKLDLHDVREAHATTKAALAAERKRADQEEAGAAVMRALLLNLRACDFGAPDREGMLRMVRGWIDDATASGAGEKFVRQLSEVDAYVAAERKRADDAETREVLSKIARLKAALDEQKQVTNECVMRADRRKMELQASLDAANAEIARHAKAHEETIFMLNDERVKATQLTAKLGRAVAALQKIDVSKGCVFGDRRKCGTCEGCHIHTTVDAILAAPDCVAAGEYVAALEQENAKLKSIAEELRSDAHTVLLTDARQGKSELWRCVDNFNHVVKGAHDAYVADPDLLKKANSWGGAHRVSVGGNTNAPSTPSVTRDEYVAELEAEAEILRRLEQAVFMGDAAACSPDVPLLLTEYLEWSRAAVDARKAGR
jgi:hypothetical protein